MGQALPEAPLRQLSLPTSHLEDSVVLRHQPCWGSSGLERHFFSSLRPWNWQQGTRTEEAKLEVEEDG